MTTLMSKRLATFAAAGVGAAATLAGIATTTAAPANAAPKFSAIVYSPATGAWGWAMLAGTQQQAVDVAMTNCAGAGGTDCQSAAKSSAGGCVALVRSKTDGAVWYGGTGPTSAEAQGNAFGRIGGGDLLVSTCSGTDAEQADPKGAGGVSPLPAPKPAPAPAPAPAPEPAPAPAAPKLGPTVSSDPGLTGVTFHVTDRSGVASQCTYSSEGFQSSFGLPANGTFDLDVPAVRLFKNRTGKVTCDNGTSTNTSVFY